MGGLFLNVKWGRVLLCVGIASVVGLVAGYGLHFVGSHRLNDSLPRNEISAVNAPHARESTPRKTLDQLNRLSASQRSVVASGSTPAQPKSNAGKTTGGSRGVETLRFDFSRFDIRRRIVDTTVSFIKLSSAARI